MTKFIRNKLKRLFIKGMIPFLVIILVACSSKSSTSNGKTTTSNESETSTTTATTEPIVIGPHDVYDYTEIFSKSASILSTSEFELLPSHSAGDKEIIVTDLGYFIEAESTGAHVIYRNIVDLNEVTGNVIEFEAYHNESSNFDEIQVSLIDIYDANNMVTVTFSQNVETDLQSFVSVLVNGKEGAMNNSSSNLFYTSHAVNYRNNFKEEINQDYTHSAFNFRFDVNTNQIFSSIDSNSEFMLLDLDDEAILKNSTFSGFKTNEVYIKIEFRKVDINSNAQLAIKKIGNRQFGQDIENVSSNLIRLEMNPHYFQDHLPVGAVNKVYQLPVPIYEDYLLGPVSVLQKLYFGSTDKSNMISNHAFTPDETGTYTLKYEAVDIYGNTVTRDFDIEIMDTMIPIQVNFQSISSYEIFEEVLLPSVAVSGGHGELNTEIKYYFNDELIEDETSITFQEIGKLKVVVNVTDYINQNISKTKEYTVTGSTMLNILNGIPRALISGTTYKVSDFEAIDYSQSKDSNDYYLEKSVYIDGVKLDDDLQYEVPSDKDQVVITFFGAEGTNKEISESVVVDIIQVDATHDASGFILHDNYLDASQVEDGVLLTTTDTVSTTTAALPNGMVAHELGIEFITKNPTYAYIEFTFTDIFTNKQVKVRYYRANDNTIVKLQDQTGDFSKQFIIDDIFAENKSIVFYLDNVNHYLLDYYYTNIAKIEYYADGTKFNGFQSNAVSLDITLGLAKVDSQFIISRIGNQSFKSGNYASGDTTAPQIAFFGNFDQTKVGINTTLQIPAAKAYDVLQNNSSALISVMDPDGNYIIKDSNIDHEVEVSFEKYGIYRLIYTTKDSLNNTKHYQKMITVIDEIGPNIVIDGSYNQEYKVDDTITLNEFTVDDNIDASTDIDTAIFIRDHKTYQFYQFNPKDTFEFDHAGIYEIVYYAADSSMNITREVITIVVR